MVNFSCKCSKIYFTSKRDLNLHINSYMKNAQKQAITSEEERIQTDDDEDCILEGKYCYLIIRESQDIVYRRY